MLYFSRMLKSAFHEPQTAELAALTTVWGEALDRENPLPEHPRPTLERKRWKSLNGMWDYAFASVDDAPEWMDEHLEVEWVGKICVPFSPEAPLSGVGVAPDASRILVEECSLKLPKLRIQERIILHFEAVDWECSVWLNGERLGSHRGGYTPFSFDATSAARSGKNVLRVQVFDPAEHGTQLRGKQRIDRGTMWYTAQSGIWQSVWYEIVPELRIAELRVAPDADAARLTVAADIIGGSAPIKVELADGEGKAVARAEGPAEGVVFELGEVRLWSPDDPQLYRLTVSCGKDKVKSYCAFRTVGVEDGLDGRPRFCLNHEPFFLRGLLEQGYWPDGLMTAPSDEALVFDIETMKELGFNMLRMHIKLERERFYYHCDRLGMLVFQDMVSGGGPLSAWQTQQKPTLFPGSWTGIDDSRPASWKKLAADDSEYRREWIETARDAVVRLGQHPSIAAWVLFNESWGQFCAGEATRMVGGFDPTRPILSVSGWYDQGTGDFHGIHNYFRPQKLWRDRARTPRAELISEFGGLTWHDPEHSSLPASYGYADFESIQEWRDELERLLASMDALEEQGLSGFVYTQVSDVEEETNGLLSYDRRVNKLRD